MPASSSARTLRAMLSTSRPESVFAFGSAPASSSNFAFAVRVDGDLATGTIVECNEDDNGAMGTERCAGLE